MNNLLFKFRKHIQSQFPELIEKSVLLGISGGVDSIVLADLLLKSNVSLGLIHCNFQLRDDESNADEDFVYAFAEEKKVPLFITRFDTTTFASEAKLSIQEAARILRYRYFDEIRSKENYDFISTAHHFSDSVETSLFHLIRGTGIRGLLGIPNRNGSIIRPLLPFLKDEILDYATENQLKWRDDSSNFKSDYMRNKIRLELIPLLYNLNSSFEKSMMESMRSFAQTQSLAMDAAAAVLSQVVIDEGSCKKIDIKKLLRFDNYEAYLYFWLEGFGFTAWTDIYKLPFAENGKCVFSNLYCLQKDRDFLTLSLKNSEPEFITYIETVPFTIKEPIQLRSFFVSAFQQSSSESIVIDASLLDGKLCVRNYRQSDTFAPEGMSVGSKKVGKFLRDEKVSINSRKSVLVLCDESRVIWVIGYRANREFIANSSSKSFLKITFHP